MISVDLMKPYRIGLHRKGPLFFLVTKAVVAQNLKDTDRK